jgi:hypothetical protein
MWFWIGKGDLFFLEQWHRTARRYRARLFGSSGSMVGVEPLVIPVGERRIGIAVRLSRLLVKRKYRWLFTPKRRWKPDPKGPGPELVTAIVEMKRRNPRFGSRRIAQQIALLFGVEICCGVLPDGCRIAVPKCLHSIG